MIDALLPYIDRSLQNGAPLKDITRHILGLYQGLPGARKWRQVLSNEAFRPAANGNTVLAARGAILENHDAAAQVAES